ncbi:P1 family peptidase [Acaricomes phytoseiuli]|uniref:P1 family peptidase n=1 Tax=Acaricomes phytoseiuli TaxID=291968 RepID=UPI000372E2F9|nr:P1 family peptidase [Acaricomes phytoseiuli]MCW1250153.1 P1 family peptidase [Acaricomes phytoseiuli]
MSPGVLVGQVERHGDGWLSGVSVIIPPAGTVGAVDVRGGGPGTHETDALDPTTMVSTVDAVVLSGGSAYGLASAHGVQSWCEEQGRGFPVRGGVVPIVPAAAIFDLGRGGGFMLRPGPEMGYQAAAGAHGGEVRRGNVGAGTGAAIGRGSFKGGVGTASLRLTAPNQHVVVGALAVVNAAGLPTGAKVAASQNAVGAALNTTLVVVATNAELSVAQAKRTSSVAHNGLARALAPVHTLSDGDTVFTLATGEVQLPGMTDNPPLALVELQALAAQVVQAAIEDGIRAAETLSTPGGNFPRWPV